MYLNKPKPDPQRKRPAEPSGTGWTGAVARPAPAVAAKSAAGASADLTLKGYALSAKDQHLTLYRADNRDPRSIQRDDGMRVKQHRRLAEIKGLLAQDPKLFEQAHVSSNSSFLVSTAKNEDAGGYADTRAYLYRISVPGLYKFEESPPASSDLRRQPKIYMDTPDFRDATLVLMETSKCTEEVDFLGDIPLRYITDVRQRGGDSFLSLSEYSGSA
ncbi:hypothetical protein [Streptomyces griseoviridis]|uniref:hypothetical protein n=1 Tax=Streptomyces griseoviridis TaxID=45398 RepID=UPI0034514AEB